jgi:hypothetical protein
MQGAHCLIRVKKTYRPTSREIVGMRLQACVPNEAQRKMFGRDDGSFVITKKMVPSFKGPYLIAEGSDLGEVTPADIERFKERLRFSGYTEFHMIEASEPKQPKVSPAVQAKVDAMLARLREQGFC